MYLVKLPNSWSGSSVDVDNINIKGKQVDVVPPVYGQTDCVDIYGTGSDPFWLVDIFEDEYTGHFSVADLEVIGFLT